MIWEDTDILERIHTGEASLEVIFKEKSEGNEGASCVDILERKHTRQREEPMR